MEKMTNSMLSPEAMVMVSGSSIGTQKKYYDKGYWYKQNRCGYEGRAEYLVSKVLSCSNIHEYVEQAAGQPFCVNLERQAMELGFGLKLNYLKLQQTLACEPDSRALEVLLIQLRRYENILRDDSL